MDSIQLDRQEEGLLASGKNDARYGTVVSPDFNLLNEGHPTIQTLAKDLKKIMIEALNSDIYIYDPSLHLECWGRYNSHVNTIDRVVGLNLGKQKYSCIISLWAIKIVVSRAF